MGNVRLTPDIRLEGILSLTPAQLQVRGIRAIVLDVDNTLATHNHPDPATFVKEWLQTMREAGFQLIILSNNSAERVSPFAERLGLPFESRGLKPLTRGFKRICRRFGVRPEAVAVVGDQLFTDILGGNLAGMLTVLVRPIEAERGPFFRFKRTLERILLHDPTWGRESG